MGTIRPAGSPSRPRRAIDVGAAVGIALWIVAGTTSCDGSVTRGGRQDGPPSPANAGELIPASLAILAHSPVNGALQINPSATITVTFDGGLVQPDIADDQTWLRANDENGDDIDCALSLDPLAETLSISPLQPLDEATDYLLQLSPAIQAFDGRLLEAPWRLTFTTVDRDAPHVLAADISDGATGVDRDQPIRVSLTEPVVAVDAADGAGFAVDATVLKDVFGFGHPVNLIPSGADLLVQPIASLVGSRTYTLTLTDELTDRVGNPLGDGGAPWTLTFTAAADTTAPQINSAWPAGQNEVSPIVRPTITFSESIDPASVEAINLRLVDIFGTTVPVDVTATEDQRTLRMQPRTPLVADRLYIIAVAGGAGSITDLSGNTLAGPATFTFTPGDDATPPTRADSVPNDLAVDVATRIEPLVRFNELLDADTINKQTVKLRRDQAGAVEIGLRTEQSGHAIRITPGGELAAGEDFTLTVLGGDDGVRDAAGNPLERDVTIRFRTSAIGAVPSALIQPFHGAIAVAPTARVSITFSTPIDADTVNPGTVRVDGPLGAVAGTLEVTRGDRVARFTPNAPWIGNQTYTVTVVGGSTGILSPTGAPLAQDTVAEFNTASGSDRGAPTVEVTLNEIDSLRVSNLTVPPFGFSIDVEGRDTIGFSLDSSTFELVFDGPGPGPDTTSVFLQSAIDGRSMHWQVPTLARFGSGTWSVTARVTDLSGNQGQSSPFTFRVSDLSPDATPFERTQTVWVRFDLDRNADGVPDFDEDLLRLGLAADGDPAGTNTFIRNLVADGMIAQAHRVFGRTATGDRLANSVPLWLTRTEPRGVAAMLIACGGLDPQGDPTRVYGDESSGTLGRAFFDYRNERPLEHNTGTNPGVGVFPSELWLFEARVHSQVFPSFTTTFASKFLALCPDMGGVAAGDHPADATVLRADFNFSAASPTERARYTAVMAAADDWAVAVGTILAHEVGHAVGLVATGPNPTGLHGDSSLHNMFAGTTDVMSSSVGYEALVSLEYRFRDLSDAYLRHRILMK